MKPSNALAGFGWGVLLLSLLTAGYFVALTQAKAPMETGVRVIPWQAPDLEIPSPAAEILPPNS